MSTSCQQLTSTSSQSCKQWTLNFTKLVTIYNCPPATSHCLAWIGISWSLHQLPSLASSWPDALIPLRTIALVSPGTTTSTDWTLASSLGCAFGSLLRKKGQKALSSPYNLFTHTETQKLVTEHISLNEAHSVPQFHGIRKPEFLKSTKSPHQNFIQPLLRSTPFWKLLKNL